MNSRERAQTVNVRKLHEDNFGLSKKALAEVKRGVEFSSITIDNDTKFSGVYKGHDIDIEKKDIDGEFWFYIEVTAPDGCYAYDGYWRPEEHWLPNADHINLAIDEALVGSRLVGR